MISEKRILGVIIEKRRRMKNAALGGNDIGFYAAEIHLLRWVLKLEKHPDGMDFEYEPRPDEVICKRK